MISRTILTPAGETIQAQRHGQSPTPPNPPPAEAATTRPGPAPAEPPGARAVSRTNGPTGRAGHTAVWTGSEMIVWGGEDQNFLLLNTGGRYCAQSQAPIAQSAFSRKTHGAAGTFDVPLPLTGNVGIECRS